MNMPMTHIDRLLLAVSPAKEVSRLSDAELREVVMALAVAPWSNELRERVAGLAVSEAVNRWMDLTADPSQAETAGGQKL